MKTTINHAILLAFFALLTFSSCQDEATEVNSPDEQEVITPSSPLASFMSNVTANYGAYDDILDDASCFSIELPVTIIVSDITITIETEADLEQLEDLFEELVDDEDFLDFVFPITIIFNDYTEIVIENEDQLENFINECDDDDDVIECIDFVYPISFSVFNSDFNIVDTVTIENDEALYNFLEALEEDDNSLIVSLNYPVTLEYANGETIEVNSNQELSDAIEAAEDDCDDDDYDCNEEDITELLIECPWDINDANNDFEIHQMIFYEDGTLQITEGDATVFIGGNWEVDSTDNGLVLNITELTAYQDDLGGEWLIVECDDDELDIVRGDYSIELEQDCEGDLGCSIAEINANLGECAWLLETNLINTIAAVYVYFTPNGQILLDDGDGTESQIGTWELLVVASNVYMDLTFEDDFELLNGEWQIVECEDDYFYLVNGDDYIELQQECDINQGNEVFDCFSDFELVECLGPNNEAEFNLSADTIGLILCEFSFIPSFHESIADAENNVNAIVETESYWSETGQVYLRIEAENGNFEVFTVYLITEECNLFECYQSFDAVLEQCDNGTDGPYTFDLTTAFHNCNPSADIVTYHESQADAEANVNAISNPENYAMIGVEAVVYTRVVIDDQFEIFPIILVVEDCNEGSCTEQEVDAFLISCMWNAVNYNGSDNLMEWNFDFEASNNIVVIYTDNQTIDAFWSTSQSNDGVIVTFSNVSGPNIQAITGDWLVVECEENRLEMHRGDDVLVLERTCE